MGNSARRGRRLYVRPMTGFLPRSQSPIHIGTSVDSYCITSLAFRQFGATMYGQRSSQLGLASVCTKPSKLSRPMGVPLYTVTLTLSSIKALESFLNGLAVLETSSIGEPIDVLCLSVKRSI